MNWYKKAQAKKTIAQAEKWVEQYADTNGGQQCLIYGQCDEFAADFEEYLNDPSVEIWSLWEVYEPWNKQIPYINPTNDALKKIDPKFTLSDIGFESHIVIKWEGFWWDGYGKQTLDQIMKHFDKVPNPHWFRL